MPPDSAFMLVGAVTSMFGFTPYEGAIQGDALGLVKDRELRDSLNRWIGKTADMREGTPTLYDAFQSVWVSMDAATLGGFLYGSGGGPAEVLARLRANEDFVVARLALQNFSRMQAVKVRNYGELADQVLTLIRASLASY